MIFIVRLISRTFGQNVSKIALYVFSLKKLFVKTLVNSLFHSKSTFFKMSLKKFCDLSA